MGKNPTFDVGDVIDKVIEPWVGKILWRRKWQPTPVFLSGKFQGQRKLAGYDPWGHKELDTTEQLSTEQWERRNVKWPQALWKAVWQFLKSETHTILTILPFHSSVLLQEK